MFCICLPSVSQVNLTKSIQKKDGQKRINQLTCFNQPNILESKNPMQTRPFNINLCRCRSGTCESALEHPVVFFKRHLPGPREIFSPPKKKLQDLGPDKIAWRSSDACFLFGWTLDVYPKNWKKLMKEKSKVQRSCLFKNNHFPNIQDQIQGSKRLVDGIGWDLSCFFNPSLGWICFSIPFSSNDVCNAWHLWRGLVLMHKI